MAKLRPLGDNVIVKPLNAEKTTASGIVLPDTVSKEKPMRGKIIAIGEGKEDKTLNAKIGDTVIFTQYAPTEVKIEGEEFFILGFDSVLAVEE
ncbi:co-chaperone GroES [Candidatus Gracilibacteria bacterium]|nr:co-chaperone GroES [Candidatus Gracilibacteria bacterium]